MSCLPHRENSTPELTSFTVKRDRLHLALHTVVDSSRLNQDLDYVSRLDPSGRGRYGGGQTQGIAREPSVRFFGICKALRGVR